MIITSGSPAFANKDVSGGPGLINAGVYWVSQRFVAYFSRDTKVSLEQEIFPAWVGSGLFGMPTRSPVRDIGVPEAYALAQHELQIIKANG